MAGTNDVSRRGLGYAGLGHAAAAAAVSGVSPAEAASTEPTAAPLEDPTRKYSRPPFQKQAQPWPGLARKMDPKPDH